MSNQNLDIGKDRVIIFLDDERVIGDVNWIEYYNKHDSVIYTYRTYNEFTSVVDSFLSRIPLSNILWSLDHDIQCYDSNGNEQTGYDWVKYLCDKVIELNLDANHLDVIAHSKNPIGKINIESYVDNFKRHTGPKYYLFRKTSPDGYMMFIKDMPITHKTTIEALTTNLNEASVYEYNKVKYIDHTGLTSVRCDIIDKIGIDKISLSDYVTTIGF